MASGPDLTRALRFDLPHGAVRLDGDPALVVSAKALGQLLSSATAETRATVGGEVGAAMGARVQTRLGSADAVRGASLESAVTHLSAELSLGGFGTLALERWGRALVVHVTGAPIDAPDFFASLVASAVSHATGASAFSTVLDSKDGVRVLIASQAAAQRVHGWLDQGVAWAEAVARLQGGAS
jgi:hypothetical protein